LYYQTFSATFDFISIGQFQLIGNVSTTNFLSLQLASMFFGSHMKDYLNIVTTCLWFQPQKLKSTYIIFLPPFSLDNRLKGWKTMAVFHNAYTMHISIQAGFQKHTIVYQKTSPS